MNLRDARLLLLLGGLGLLVPAHGFAQVDGPASPPSPIGTWEGALSVQPGVELPLVFHIAGDDGELTATLDSPSQGATGIVAEVVTYEAGRLTLEFPVIAGAFEGELREDGAIEGEWRQGPARLPLTLRRGTGEAALTRPQHPQPPFPYRSEEVRIRNAAADLELAGTLTLPPAGEGPFAAALLIPGSGPLDRDETLFGHKPFLVLADHLTRAGMAVLRVDGRGVGESEGDFAAATTLDFASDAAAATSFLRERPEIDPARVGLIGHSEGGLIAPLVATGTADAPRVEVAFVVLLAGPGLPGGEILRLQAEALSRAAGASEEEVRQALDFQTRMQQVIREEPEAIARRARLRALLESVLAELDAEERAAQGIPADQEETWIDAQLGVAASDWFRGFVLLDPRLALEQLRVPVLALAGGLNLQVPPRENLAAIGQALEAAGNPDVTLLELPGLNHLFQTAGTGSPEEYAAIEETFAPGALDALADWLAARFR